MKKDFYYVNQRTNEVTADERIFSMWYLCGDKVDLYFGEPSADNPFPRGEFC